MRDNCKICSCNSKLQEVFFGSTRWPSTPADRKSTNAQFDFRCVALSRKSKLKAHTHRRCLLCLASAIKIASSTLPPTVPRASVSRRQYISAKKTTEFPHHLVPIYLSIMIAASRPVQFINFSGCSCCSLSPVHKLSLRFIL